LINKPDELARTVELAARKAGTPGAVLILLDADDDLPCVLAPGLLDRARSIRSDIPISVVAAKREYEAWFLAAARSLRGEKRLRDDTESPPDPESVRGAKEWLDARIDGGYSEVLHQPAFSELMDLTQARTAPSFDKFYRDTIRLIREVCYEPSGIRERCR
jgi:hypothetical protein